MEITQVNPDEFFDTNTILSTLRKMNENDMIILGNEERNGIYQKAIAANIKIKTKKMDEYTFAVVCMDKINTGNNDKKYKNFINIIKRMNTQFTKTEITRRTPQYKHTRDALLERAINDGIIVYNDTTKDKELKGKITRVFYKTKNK